MLTSCYKASMGITNTDFAYLRRLVREHAAVVLDEDKQYLADLHLEPVAIASGFDSIASLVAHLRTHPFSSLHHKAIDALVTKETLFFRDIYPFEALQKHILPQLIEQQQTERNLNIWCAACSSGQEPYSIAMLMREHFPLLANWNVQLIASDYSRHILARARQGRYSQLEVKRGLPPNLRQKYFYPEGNEWQIKDEIRSLVDFRQLNLIEPWPSLPQMDIIFLRNVLIYFDTPTKKAILNKLKQVLKPDGYLFLGGGETTINLDDGCDRIQLGKCICHRLRS